MNECERLAAEMEKALQGGAWHGESWKELLAGVDRKAALARPVPGVHTIAEVVRHATVWQDGVRLRMEGEPFEASGDRDWPPVDPATDAAWSEAVERLLESGRKLAETVRSFPPERLHEHRSATTGPWYELVLGELQHILYHAGQVGLLKKAASGTLRT